MTAQFLQVTPFMHVAGIVAAVTDFRDPLGFAFPFETPGYVPVERNGCRLRVLRHPLFDARQKVPPP